MNTRSSFCNQKPFHVASHSRYAGVIQGNHNSAVIGGEGDELRDILICLCRWLVSSEIAQPTENDGNNRA